MIRTANVVLFFFFQAEDGIRDATVTGVQTCALPISEPPLIADLDRRKGPFGRQLQHGPLVEVEIGRQLLHRHQAVIHVHARLDQWVSWPLPTTIRRVTMTVKKYLDLLCFTRECVASKQRAAGLLERLSSCSTYGVRVWRPGRKNPGFQIASVSEPPVGFEPTT